MTNIKVEEGKLDYWLSPEAIRQTTSRVYELALADKCFFTLHEEKLEEVCEYVVQVIKDKYPDLQIPFHSRWSHFQVGGIDRLGELKAQLSNLSDEDYTKCLYDLVVVSVLLDAGAGQQWSFIEEGRSFSRSEGLAVASYHMFVDGLFSSNSNLQVDAKALQNLKPEQLAQAFQVSEKNPLVGVEGRCHLLNQLGQCLAKNPECFGPEGRPGGLIHYFSQVSENKEIAADFVLKTILKAFADIWPGRIHLNNMNVGDVWYYSRFGELEESSLVAFHKLSQWLSYSLLEPLMDLGWQIKDLNKLTGLAEYRNGGLFFDLGVIELKDKNFKNNEHKPESDIIIEWRALTLQLLERLHPMVAKKLGLPLEEFSLTKLLEGGTWHAGRKIAKELRESGEPPLKLDSDATVF